MRRRMDVSYSLVKWFFTLVPPVMLLSSGTVSYALSAQQTLESHSGAFAGPAVSDEPSGRRITERAAEPESVSLPFVRDSQMQGNFSDKVGALLQAGYSFAEIALLAKKEGTAAHLISRAGLRHNISGPEIYAALLSAGFSSRQADAAVPAALRSEGQWFPVQEQKDTAAIDQILIRPNPLSGGELTDDQKKISPQERVLQGLNAPPLRKITSDWKTLLGNEFIQPIGTNVLEKGPSIVQAMIKERYTLAEIVTGFQNNNCESTQIAVVLGLAGISESDINALLRRR